MTRNSGSQESLAPLCLVLTAALFAQWNALLLVAISTAEIDAGVRSEPDSVKVAGVLWSVATIIAVSPDVIQGLRGVWHKRRVYRLSLIAGSCIGVLGSVCGVVNLHSATAIASATNFGLVGAAWLMLLLLIARNGRPRDACG